MKKVLIVEDEAVIALTYKRALQDYYITNSVTTGLDAITSVINNQPDLILMDIMLGGDMDGIEAARQIQNFSEIPFFFLSGNTDKETKEEALKLNPCGYLKKPVNYKELVNKVNSIL